MIKAIIHGIGDIPYDPSVLPEEWCNNQPCAEIGGVVLSQPLSSFIVFLTALITIAVGVYFLRTKNDQKSRLFLGWCFIFVGVGAFLAGISYQAFGYEIKCRGREECMWTSWWEIAYMLVTVFGVNYLFIGISHTSMSQNKQKSIKIYSLITSIIYILLIIIGSVIPIKFLISFEMMLIFVFPVYLAIIIFGIRLYIKQKSLLSKRLLIAALLLMVAIGAYYIYYMLEITQLLWDAGIWFSDNDVLHVLMIVWVLYIYKKLGPIIEDSKESHK